jgi:prepilin-type N-terminal cleavage/methylation domain-containing protein
VSDERGFTIVEVMVAMMVLIIGATALVGSSGLVSRQIGRGRSIRRATQVATQRLETLRRAANRRTSVGGSRCQHASFAGGTATTLGMSESWGIVSAGGNLRSVVDTVTYGRTSGTSRVILRTLIACY